MKTNLKKLAFFEVWKLYTRARARSSHYKEYSDELNKRIADTMTLLNCDKRTAIEDLMKR